MLPSFYEKEEASRKKQRRDTTPVEVKRIDFGKKSEEGTGTSVIKSAILTILFGTIPFTLQTKIRKKMLKRQNNVRIQKIRITL